MSILGFQIDVQVVTNSYLLSMHLTCTQASNQQKVRTSIFNTKHCQFIYKVCKITIYTYALHFFQCISIFQSEVKVSFMQLFP